MNQYIRPKLVENKSKNWVLNGQNNSFYNYVVDRFNGSPTNSAILSTYIDLMIGNGLNYKNSELSAWVKLKQVLNKKDLRRLITDFIIFGECSFHVVKAKNGKDLAAIYHLPIQNTAPAIANEDNEIESYWICRDWRNTMKNEPIQIAAFGFDEKAKEHIYKLNPYAPNREYFANPSYFSGLSYCEMEEEISNYYISHIKNGLSFGYIVNIPAGSQMTEEQQDEIERKIKSKLTGSSNAGKFVLSFNDVNGEKTTIEVVQLNDAHKQWEYLTGEARQQIMTAHRVISPMLFGIKDNTGLGNNADELDTAEKQMYKRVVQPKQSQFLEALDDILNAYNINLDLYFRPLTEQATSVQMSEQNSEMYDLLFSYSEPIPDGHDLEKVELVEFSAIQNSEQDSEFYKIRYAYNIGTSKTPISEGRDFCKNMMQLSNSGRVFRKEDIDAMSVRGVNGEFAHSGGKYDIFKFGGGVNCYHRWERRIYKKREAENGEPMGGNPMQNTFDVNVNQARREGAKIPKNHRDVAIAEIDKPNKGRYNG